MNEEFKCPYCEGTASIAYHRTGNNLLYCHDCKRTFSERDAKIMKQAARIVELEKRVEACRLANRVLRHKQKELRAKLNQWRKVLEEIAESDNGVDADGFSCFFCDRMIYIARKALKGAGE